ncbi:MAG: alpha-amylase family glycosyl hydrolase [Clostridia bacterium]|nr:alpha-amylase family glycosyl hydrolase [Clostridia bacterium]
MWYDEAVFYQIFPLGFCDGLRDNDGVMRRCITDFEQWIPHLKNLGINAVYFSPIFESDYHGYDTRDYRVIDRRIGTNKNFAELVKKLHEAGIKAVIDGVFNHVGRGFFAFKDVCEKKWDSQYKDWFNINFDGNSPYNDGFWYEGWEGYYNLVKLNHNNPAVGDYLIESVRSWVDEFDIDGIRLDVAYCLNRDFMKRLRYETDRMKPEFFLVGEMLHGDYNTIVNDECLHSATNYECYKGLYSSFNSMNMFEIAHSLERQFGKEQWCLYTGKHLLTFVDNHDVSRIASMLTNKAHLPLIYALMFGMPGIPCIYYGSEWGCEAVKGSGNDNVLRPAFTKPESNELTKTISDISNVYHNTKALSYGEYTKKLLTNRQFVFKREYDGEKILVAVNADDKEYTACFDTECENALNLITGQTEQLSGEIRLPAYSFRFYRCS